MVKREDGEFFNFSRQIFVVLLRVRGTCIIIIRLTR